MSEPDPKLSPLGERWAKALESAEPSPGLTVIVGLGAIWIAWGWRAALGAGGVYLLALAWKWVTE